MKKNRLIVVEGSQGTGKTTLTNYLRDNIPSSNLYRLQGQKDKTETGKCLSIKMYDALLSYLEKMQEIPMDLIFDRTFFTEEVYCQLGYKNYQFTDYYEKLVKRLEKLDYEIYFIVLYLEDTTIYEQRLKRGHHTYQAFSIDNSVNQQEKYLEMARSLESTKFHVYSMSMDDFSHAYEKINKILDIKR